MKQKGFALVFVLALIFAIFLIVGIGIVYWPFSKVRAPTGTTSQTKTTTIKSVRYNSDCTVEVTLNNGEKRSVIATTEEKTCSGIYSPIVSPDGKYGAFELWTLEKDPTMISGKAANHAVFVYFSGQKDWANVYQFGAAWVKNMSFDQNDNLLLTVTNGEIIDSKKILLPIIASKFVTVVDPQTKKINYSGSFLPDDVLKTQ